MIVRNSDGDVTRLLGVRCLGAIAGQVKLQS